MDGWPDFQRKPTLSEQQNLTQLIEHYLGFILLPERIGEDGGVKTDAPMHILDQLAIRTHDKSGIIPENEGEDVVRLDYQDTYKSLTQHFPDYSYYSAVLDINDAVKDDNLAAADPLDDLADIAVDLAAVIAVSEKYGEAAGQYAFVESYRIHWGYHLRQLQVYLHCQMTGC